MGFGLLFVGYLFFFNTVFYDFSDIFACLLLLYGLSVLKQYAPYFSRAYGSLFPLLIFSGVAFLYRILCLFGLLPEPALVGFWEDLLSSGFRFYFILGLLAGVEKIAIETGVPHIRYRAMRNRIFTVLYFVARLALILCSDIPALTGNEVIFWLSTVLMVLGILYHFLNAKLLFSCYVWICLEGDEEMARGQSKNPVVNFINRFTDKLEDKVLESKQRQAEEEARRRQEKDKRHPHKQRKSDKRSSGK